MGLSVVARRWGATVVAFLILALGLVVATFQIEQQQRENQKQQEQLEQITARNRELIDALAKEVDDRTKAFCESRFEARVDNNEILLNILNSFDPTGVRTQKIRDLILKRDPITCP